MPTRSGLSAISQKRWGGVLKSCRYHVMPKSLMKPESMSVSPPARLRRAQLRQFYAGEPRDRSIAIQIPVGMVPDDFLARHGRLRLDPEHETKSIVLAGLAQGANSVGIITRARKPIAAGFPPRVGWIVFNAEGIAVPARIDSIELGRDLMVVHPFEISNFAIDGSLPQLPNKIGPRIVLPLSWGV